MTTDRFSTTMRGATLGLALTCAAATARAQLPSASAAALAMGDNYTAAARGFSAMAWNPANLGLAGNPRSSIALLPLSGTYGLDPLTLSDLKQYQGRVVPDDVKELWLSNVSSAGAERAAAGANLTYLAATIGSFGVQASTTMRSSTRLNPAVMELVLFGNAGRTGEPRDLSLSGGALSADAMSTVGVSFGHGFGGATSQHAFALGATVKYTMGHFRTDASDVAGSTTASPVTVNFAMPTLMSSAGANNGSGFGLDLGASWSGASWSAGLVVQNAFNSFRWDASKFYYRPVEFQFDQNVKRASADSQAFASAPASLRDRVASQAFKPVVGFGGSMRVSSALTMTADVREQMGDGIDIGPKMHAGVGAELRAISFLPLRAGVAAVSGGYQFGAGAGLELGPLHMNFAAGQRRADLGTEPMGMFTLSFGGR